MIKHDARTVLTMPVDQLAFELLADLVKTNEWNENNYLVVAKGLFPQHDAAVRAIAEAFAWARAHALIARSPGQSTYDAMFVSRAGHEALASGLNRVRGAVRLSAGLHPLIEQRSRPQFLLAEFEQAVFVAMKAVEIRVRALAGLGADSIGVDLMNRAFGRSGSLTDLAAVKGEQEGTRAIFAGAYAVLRNPSGHREVDYDDVAGSAEAVTTASLLMRILDKVEKRLANPTGP